MRQLDKLNGEHPGRQAAPDGQREGDADADAPGFVVGGSRCDLMAGRDLLLMSGRR